MPLAELPILTLSTTPFLLHKCKDMPGRPGGVMTSNLLRAPGGRSACVTCFSWDCSIGTTILNRQHIAQLEPQPKHPEEQFLS